MNVIYAKIWHKKNCSKCKLTQRILKMPVEMILIDPISKPNDPIVQYMRKNNMKSAPLVRIYDDNNNQVDEWNDFRVNKINKYKEIV